MASISNNHARPAAFRRLLRGDASPAEVQSIVRHLLAGCDACHQRLTAARLSAGSPATWSYDKAFAAVARRADRDDCAEDAAPARCYAEEAHP